MGVGVGVTFNPTVKEFAAAYAGIALSADDSYYRWLPFEPQG